MPCPDLRPLLCPLLLLTAAPLACTTFVEGESSSAGLSTSDGSTTAGTGESETAGSASTTASTTTSGSAGSTSATGSTSMTTTLTTTSSTTVDPTTAGPTSDPSTTEPVTTTDTDATTGPMPSCDNGAKDGAETDVDCGGGTCPLCQIDQTCLVNGDCASGLCEGACVDTPQSCAELLAEMPGAADGIHTIYPGGAALEIKCDMLGGGWTCVYANDFNDNAEGWSDPTRESCGSAQILGRFANKAETAREIDLLGVPHAEIRVTGDLYVIDSWDNEKVTIRVDNTEIWSKSCNTNNCGQQDDLCGAFWDDVVVPIVATGMHKEAKASVRFATNLSESKSNESYGVDNIEVCVK